MLKRLMIAALLLLVAAVPAGPAGAQIPDRARTVTFDDAGDSVAIALVGLSCANVSVAAGTLTATLVATASFDGGVTYQSAGSDISAVLVDPVKATAGASLSLTNPNDATSRGILIPAGATHAKVSMSAYTSGSAAVTVRALTACPGVMAYGTDGNNLRALRLLNSNPAADEYGVPVRFIGSSLGGTSMTDDTAFTPGTTAVTPIAGTYRSVRDAVDDNDGGALAMTSKRGLYVAVETPNGDLAMDEALDAVRTTPVSVTEVGGKAATTTTTPFTNCPSQAGLRMTSATTTMLVDAVADKTVRVCWVHVDFDTESASNTLQFVRGTGTNCGTGKTDVAGISGANLTWSKSFVSGTNSNEIFDAGAVNTQLCAVLAGTSSATVQIRYGVF